MSIIDIFALKLKPEDDNGVDISYLLEKKRKEAAEDKKQKDLEKRRTAAIKRKNKYIESKEKSGLKSCNIFIAEDLLTYIDEEIEQSGDKLNRSDIINSILKEKYNNNKI